jgi:hypothetical protein
MVSGYVPRAVLGDVRSCRFTVVPDVVGVTGFAPNEAVPPPGRPLTAKDTGAL